jgi:hypothetical protein
MAVSQNAPHKNLMSHPVIKLVGKVMGIIGAIALALEFVHYARTGEFEL